MTTDATATPPASSDREPARWPVLAGVRFLLALGIAHYHLLVVRPPEHVAFFGELGPTECIAGFLVISGYSIAHSISARPAGFVRRRAARILPVYYVTLLLAIAPYVWSPSGQLFRIAMPSFGGEELVGSLLLQQCFLTGKIPVFGPSWTLAIEWWFYMTAPLLMRLRARWLVALVLASAVVAQVGVEQRLLPIHEFRWGLPAAMLLWAWLSGFLFHRTRGWGAAAVALLGYWVVTRFPGPGGLAYVIAAFAIVQADALPPIPRGVARVLEYLGDISYPLYLVHVPLMLWTSRWTDWVNGYAYLGLALLAAAVLYHAIDAPIRRRLALRRRAAPPDERAPARAAA